MSSLIERIGIDRSHLFIVVESIDMEKIEKQKEKRKSAGYEDVFVTNDEEKVRVEIRTREIGYFVYDYDNLAKCVEAAVASSLPSHGSKPAVAVACAVAVAVAGGVHGGYSPNEILNMAYDAALYGEKKGADITAPSVAKRIRMIERIVDESKEAGIHAILDEIVGVFGASMYAYESVPVALGAFYAVNGHGKEGVLAAINAGDDADTNGAICGNICGAYSGASSFPEIWRERVQKTSCLDMKTMAERLLLK